jgi:hypothetical protein
MAAHFRSYAMKHDLFYSPVKCNGSTHIIFFFFFLIHEKYVVQGKVNVNVFFLRDESKVGLYVPAGV